MSTGLAQTDRASPLERIAVNAILVIAVVYALYPVLWVISLAFSSGSTPELRALPIPRIRDLSLDNFRLVTGWGDPARGWLFARQLGNSLVVSAATAAAAILIATPTAYALARHEFVDTRTGLVLVYAATAVPFAIFQLRGAFLAIPVDLEEAAMVDGATRAQAFLKVALPAARPAIAVTALFAFMSAWNEFILAATLLGRESAFTLPVVLQSYVGEYNTSWGAFAAGAILVSVPVMALFYVAQRQLVSGLTAGGVKG